MPLKPKAFSNFSRAIHTVATEVRPDNEEQVKDIFSTNKQGQILARGKGMSYSDCCVNHQKTIVDTTRLNHLLSFDPSTGIAKEASHLQIYFYFIRTLYLRFYQVHYMQR